MIAKLSAANLKAAFVQGFFLLCVGLEHGLVEVDEAVSELGHRVQRVCLGLEPERQKSERSTEWETKGGGTNSLILLMAEEKILTFFKLTSPGG